MTAYQPFSSTRTDFEAPFKQPDFGRPWDTWQSLRPLVTWSSFQALSILQYSETEHAISDGSLLWKYQNLHILQDTYEVHVPQAEHISPMYKVGTWCSCHEQSYLRGCYRLGINQTWQIPSCDMQRSTNNTPLAQPSEISINPSSKFPWKGFTCLGERTWLSGLAGFDPFGHCS